jgi:hypothetical protein
LLTTNGAYYSSALLGLNRLYSPAVFVFILIGVAAALGDAHAGGGVRRAASLCGLAATALFVGFYMLFLFQDVRFLLPILPLLLAFAGFGVARTVTFSYERRISPSRLVLLVLFAVAVSGLGAALYARATAPPDPPYQYELCESYRTLLPPDGCVITGIDPALLDHVVLHGTPRSFFAVSERCPYVGATVQPRAGGPTETVPIPVAARNVDEIRTMIAGGRTVMVDDWVDPHHPGRWRGGLEALRARFILEEVGRRGPFRIYRLVNR